MLRGMRPLNCAGTYPAVGLGMLIPESVGVALTQGMADKTAAIPATISTFLWELTATLDCRPVLQVGRNLPQGQLLRSTLAPLAQATGPYNTPAIGTSKRCNFWGGSNQGPSVLMLRGRRNLQGITYLHDFALAHYGDSRRKVAHNRHGVGDEQIGEPQLTL